jgi:aminoglycoside phosphotransferase (APT) family kinase protein
MNQQEQCDRIADFLSAQSSTHRRCQVSNLRSIAGGYSRHTTRFTVKKQDGEVEDLILQVEPVGGSAIGNVDRQSEWDLLSHLAQHSDVKVPAARFFDVNGDYLGAPAMVTQAIEGDSLLASARGSSESGQRDLAMLLARVAADVHRADTATLPGGMARPDSWDVYMDAQIAQWSDIERAHPGSDPFMRYVGAWLDANRPPPAPLSLVHGDFQIPNVLLPDRGSDYALIDWELSHIGDPREDLGWFKLVAATTPPDLIGVDDIAFCHRYRELTGLADEVINPLTVAYFTVMSSLRVFSGIQAQGALVAEAPQAVTSAYNILIQSFIHGVWMQAISGLNQMKQAAA